MATYEVKALCRGISERIAAPTAHAAAVRFADARLPHLTLQGVLRHENTRSDAEGRLFAVWSVSASHQDPNEPGERLWVYEQIGGW